MLGVSSIGNEGLMVQQLKAVTMVVEDSYGLCTFFIFILINLLFFNKYNFEIKQNLLKNETNEKIFLIIFDESFN